MPIRRVDDAVTEAKRRIENLSVDQMSAELAKGGGDVLLIDLREEAELRDEGRIPGAKHVPRGLLEFCADPADRKYAMPDFQPERRTILYCAGGRRSALAAKALKDMGYTNVAHLEGGFRGWKEAGAPIEKAT